MAGTLTVDSVQSSTTGAPTFKNSSGTEIGQLCRAWVNFAGSTGTITGSFNVSSVTRIATGLHTISFTNSMPDTKYTFMGSARDFVDSTAYYTPVLYARLSDTKTTSALQVRSDQSNKAATDFPEVNVVIFR